MWEAELIKTKIFYSSDYTEVDQEVNEFIKDKDVVDIKFHVFKESNVDDDDENLYYRFVKYREW